VWYPRSDSPDPPRHPERISENVAGKKSVFKGADARIEKTSDAGGANVRTYL